MEPTTKMPTPPRDRPMTAQMEGALRWLASRGEMAVHQGPNEFIMDRLSVRTAHALERRGYAERRWTGGQDATVYITADGEQAANHLDGITEEDYE